MASYKLFTMFLVFFMVQSSLAKPVDDLSQFYDSSEEEMRKNPTPAQKILLFTYDNVITLCKNYGANAYNTSRKILKDESLMANEKPEVLEFKKNLTMFVEKYEANKKPLEFFDIIDIFRETSEKYSDIPKEKLSPESKFIVEILDKYNGDVIVQEFSVEFLLFMNNFVKTFEENKAGLDKPMLDWYEKYCGLSNVEEKIDAILEFIDFA